ncbi:uncharacterized protein BYT42DRAFT_617384 [Radiomyces spectabilis]|uniref:uncharacterized protein n=1 Tax=Radiomyces spectabilis TaxID=64574 RepID=UPI00222052FA|nr:uncharacterized protein BYT42DRAFT_617384 [Radiomyces spectabilis]KAI8369353.1 hypothetical protein BYT42DRAFT_617384 [Radiomyces spectabilis]
MPQRQHFADNFWESTQRNGVITLFKRMTDTKENCQSLQKMFEARAMAEEEYASNLSRLADMLGTIKEDRTLETTHHILQEELKNTAALHKKLSKDISTHIAAPLRHLIQEQKELRKSLQLKVKSLHDSRQLQAHCVLKARNRYNSECARANGLVRQQHGKQRRMSYLRANHTIENFHKTYKDTLVDLETVTEQWNTLWRTVCDQLEAADENRINFLKEKMWQSGEIMTQCLEEEIQIHRNTAECCEAIDVDVELNMFVENNKTNSEPPEATEYVKICALREHLKQQSIPDNLIAEDSTGLTKEASGAAITAAKSAPETDLLHINESHQLKDESPSSPMIIARMEIYGSDEESEDTADSEEDIAVKELSSQSETQSSVPTVYSTDESSTSPEKHAEGDPCESHTDIRPHQLDVSRNSDFSNSLREEISEFECTSPPQKTQQPTPRGVAMNTMGPSSLADRTEGSYEEDACQRPHSFDQFHAMSDASTIEESGGTWKSSSSINGFETCFGQEILLDDNHHQNYQDYQYDGNSGRHKENFHSMEARLRNEEIRATGQQMSTPGLANQHDSSEDDHESFGVQDELESMLQQLENDKMRSRRSNRIPLSEIYYSENDTFAYHHETEPPNDAYNIKDTRSDTWKYSIPSISDTTATSQTRRSFDQFSTLSSSSSRRTPIISSQESRRPLGGNSPHQNAFMRRENEEYGFHDDPTPVPIQDYAVALFDYTAEDEDELTFYEGDILAIAKKNEDGWWDAFLYDNEHQQLLDFGRIPSNFVSVTSSF